MFWLFFFFDPHSWRKNLTVSPKTHRGGSCIFVLSDILMPQVLPRRNWKTLPKREMTELLWLDPPISGGKKNKKVEDGWEKCGQMCGTALQMSQNPGSVAYPCHSDQVGSGFYKSTKEPEIVSVNTDVCHFPEHIMRRQNPNQMKCYLWL